MSGGLSKSLFSAVGMQVRLMTELSGVSKETVSVAFLFADFVGCSLITGAYHSSFPKQAQSAHTGSLGRLGLLLTLSMGRIACIVSFHWYSSFPAWYDEVLCLRIFLSPLLSPFPHFALKRKRSTLTLPTGICEGKK